MVVVFVIPRLESGGAERVMRLVAENLSTKNPDWKVVLISLLDRPSPHTHLSSKTSPLEVITLGCNKVSFSIIKLRFALMKHQADVVVSTLPHVIRMVAILKILMRGSFSHIARLANTYSAQFGKSSSLPFSFTRFTHRGINHFIAVSAGVKTDYEVTYAVPPGKISVINNPIDPSSFTYSHIANIRQRPFKRVLTIGRLVEQKNLGLAFQAFKYLLTQMNSPLRLTIVGDGPHRPLLVELAKNLGLSENVEFMGYQRDVGDLYNSADIFLLTSLYEGFPNVIIEALHHGLPVVSVDCPSGPSEILCDSILGSVVTYDPEQIALALKGYLENGLDDAMQEYRKQHVLLNFSLDQITEEYKTLIVHAKGQGTFHAS
jgi:glycosyltransferase involved in cell wall biosynthesis